MGCVKSRLRQRRNSPDRDWHGNCKPVLKTQQTGEFSMRKNKKTVARLIFPVLLWLILAGTGESIAEGHYRIGTLNESVHYRDNDEVNSSHDGIYLVHKRNVFGTYYNSEREQSVFYARTHPINRTFSYSYGAVLGYNFGVVPMLGLSAQMSIFKLTLTPEAAVVGLEMPLF